jgi:hypothetical protein
MKSMAFFFKPDSSSPTQSTAFSASFWNPAPVSLVVVVFEVRARSLAAVDEPVIVSWVPREILRTLTDCRRDGWSGRVAETTHVGSHLDYRGGADLLEQI